MTYVIETPCAEFPLVSPFPVNVEFIVPPAERFKMFYTRIDETLSDRLAKKIEAATQTIRRVGRKVRSLVNKMKLSSAPIASRHCLDANCSGFGPAHTSFIEDTRDALERLQVSHKEWRDVNRKPLLPLMEAA